MLNDSLRDVLTSSFYSESIRSIHLWFHHKLIENTDAFKAFCISNSMDLPNGRDMEATKIKRTTFRELL